MEAVFIRLTDLDGNDSYFNLAHIVKFGTDEKTRATAFMTVDNDSTVVKESIEEVIRKIKKAKTIGNDWYF